MRKILYVMLARVSHLRMYLFVRWKFYVRKLENVSEYCEMQQQQRKNFEFLLLLMLRIRRRKRRTKSDFWVVKQVLGLSLSHSLTYFLRRYLTPSCTPKSKELFRCIDCIWIKEEYYRNKYKMKNLLIMLNALKTRKRGKNWSIFVEKLECSCYALSFSLYIYYAFSRCIRRDNDVVP